jgi:hypothetical protein
LPKVVHPAKSALLQFGSIVAAGFQRKLLSSSTGKYRDDDPDHEFRHLQITGKLLWPAGPKIDAVQVRLTRSDRGAPDLNRLISRGLRRFSLGFYFF